MFIDWIPFTPKAARFGGILIGLPGIFPGQLYCIWDQA